MQQSEKSRTAKGAPGDAESTAEPRAARNHRLLRAVPSLCSALSLLHELESQDVLSWKGPTGSLCATAVPAQDAPQVTPCV